VKTGDLQMYDDEDEMEDVELGDEDEEQDAVDMSVDNDDPVGDAKLHGFFATGVFSI